MRLRVILAILGGGALLITCLVMIRPQKSGTIASDERNLQGSAEQVPGGVGWGSDRKESSPPTALPSRGAQRVYATAGQNSGNRATTAGASAEEIEDQVQNRIRQLSELAVQDDAASLSEILGELTNPNQEIRKAALEAVVQSGNTDAIPALKELSEKSSDPREKKDLREAIEFLKLPSLVEVTSRR
jgi:hypothetical protein